MEGSASTLVFMSLAGGFLSVASELEQWSVAGLRVLGSSLSLVLLLWYLRLILWSTCL